ncbi:type II secretion system GspH family protein [Dasania sp. GY-MA-18]|uniref:Type II secretion system protein n=1 Tax=Dasania phycosphaerae TaxID=2950436 RepID=A0A9J6RM01_9GAMM|nr:MULTISPECIES: type II secretion system protein [Dasania]MCR8923052.1 type II secretion system GspH family protein [Dasania sp. GY-MA-18]MCZ0865484.1 type II secretion system protein [Dasania phycosphaerae]MCZ0869209.1 type II secretion system protein [Dasania phycosphaerae]
MSLFQVKNSGFTLIELVSVMVLLGVLAVAAIPTFTGSDDFSAYSAQDQIITGARMAQQRAMYDRAAGSCYFLNIASNNISVIRIAGASFGTIGPTEEWRNGIAVDADVVIADAQVFFDGLGNAIDACPGSGAPLAGVQTITIGAAGLAVCVNPAGYIYAC